MARVVCIAPRWLGDALLSRGAMALLGRAGVDLTVLAGPGLGRVFADLPGTVRVLETPSATRRARLRAGWRLRHASPDAALVLPPSWTAAWVAWLTRARVRLGTRSAGRAVLFTDAIVTPPREVHLSQQYTTLAQRLCAALGNPAPAPSDPPPLRARAEEIDAGVARLAAVGIAAGTRPLVVAPGARYGPAKQYPPERFAAAVRHIHAREGEGPVIVVGATGDRDAGDAVRRSLPQCVDLVGHTELAELIGILAVARGVLANDSGTMHLAAALDVPVVGVFGSTNPAWTHPIGSRAAIVHEPVWCSPCYAPTCAQDFACMLRLSPERVADTLLGLPTVPAAGPGPV